MTVTKEMIEAAIEKTPFLPTDINRAWMQEALSAALSRSAEAGCSDAEFQQIITEMVAVATGRYEGYEDTCDPWTADNRADIDRWQATLCGAYLVKHSRSAEAGKPVVEYRELLGRLRHYIEWRSDAHRSECNDPSYPTPVDINLAEDAANMIVAMASALSTPADIEPVGWQTRRNQDFLDKYPQATEYGMTLHETEKEAREAGVSTRDMVDGRFPAEKVAAVIARPLYAALVADREPVSVPEVEALAETLCETFATADPGDDGTGKAWPYAREWEKASWREVAKAALAAAPVADSEPVSVPEGSSDA